MHFSITIRHRHPPTFSQYISTYNNVKHPHLSVSANRQRSPVLRLKITFVIIGEWSAGARVGPVCLAPWIETVQFKDFVQHVWKKEA